MRRPNNKLERIKLAKLIDEKKKERPINSRSVRRQAVEHIKQQEAEDELRDAHH